MSHFTTKYPLILPELCINSQSTESSWVKETPTAQWWWFYIAKEIIIEVIISNNNIYTFTYISIYIIPLKQPRLAALLIRSSPAFQLRYMQTLNAISAEKNSTIIFPLPIDLLSHYMKSGNGNGKRKTKSKKEDVLSDDE